MDEKENPEPHRQPSMLELEEAAKAQKKEPEPELDLEQMKVEMRANIEAAIKEEQQRIIERDRALSARRLAKAQEKRERRKVRNRTQIGKAQNAGGAGAALPQKPTPLSVEILLGQPEEKEADLRGSSGEGH